MQAVTLSINGRILESGRLAGSDPLAFLGHRIELANGYTLRSFFRLFDGYDELVRLSPFAPALRERVAVAAGSDCIHEGFDRLELSRTIEMVGFPGDPRLEIYMSFQGVKGKEIGEIKFIPLENLLDMPVSLGPLKHIVFGDRMDVFEFDTVYTLFEFMEGILWGLSFHGTPERCELRR